MGLFAELLRGLSTLLRAGRSGSASTSSGSELLVAEKQDEGPPFTVFSAKGSCARCGFNRANNGRWLDASDEQHVRSVCTVRGFDITEPHTTYCKNFDSREPAPFGAVFAILPWHDNLCAPWFGLSVPRDSGATCCLCGLQTTTGILLRLPEAAVGTCGPGHYLDWWSDYLSRRLTYFKALGEKAYSDMYDVISFSAATACYSDAKAAFHDAIATARDLELAEEARALDARLAHIKSVFRSQFK